MAGTIITDKIQTENSFLTLNVGQTLVATINSSGILNSSGGTMIGANGSVSNTAISGFINGSQLAANTVANSNIQTGSIENYMRAVNLDFGLRNRVINGQMAISQRNGTASANNSNNTYMLDRWVVRQEGTDNKFSIQQDSSANTVAGFTNSMKVTALTTETVAIGDYFAIAQKIEGFNTADLGFGTVSARPVTLSFWVRSSLTGTFSGGLINSALNRSYMFAYTISAANTWEQKSITIAGDTTGTWIGGTNGIGIELFFNLGAGANYSTAAGSWSGLGYRGATGATSVVGQNGATWYVTGVQLEEGSQPTPFEYRHFTTELQLCQRYFYLLASGSGSSISNGMYYSSSQLRTIVSFPTTMRAAPALYASSGSDYYAMEYTGGDNFNSFTIYRPSTTAAIIYNDSQASGTTGLAATIITAQAASYVGFSSEL